MNNVCLERKYMEKLTKEYNKMCDYYNDALDEAFNSAQRLSEIQKEMM